MKKLLIVSILILTSAYTAHLFGKPFDKHACCSGIDDLQCHERGGKYFSCPKGEYWCGSKCWQKQSQEKTESSKHSFPH